MKRDLGVASKDDGLPSLIEEGLVDLHQSPHELIIVSNVFLKSYSEKRSLN